jgi:hypothetical protein
VWCDCKSTEIYQHECSQCSCLHLCFITVKDGHADHAQERPYEPKREFAAPPHLEFGGAILPSQFRFRLLLGLGLCGRVCSILLFFLIPSSKLPSEPRFSCRLKNLLVYPFSLAFKEPQHHILEQVNHSQMKDTHTGCGLENASLSMASAWELKGNKKNRT